MYSPKRKAKKRTTKTIKRKSSNPRMGLFVIIGLIAVLVMWAIIHEPKSIVTNQDTNSDDLSMGEKKPHTEANANEVKHASIDANSVVDVNPSKESLKDSATRSDIPKKGETQIDLTIRESAVKLGVPDSALKRRKKDDLISYQIPIDRSQMDLTYANMIFKGELEKCGAILLKGTDNRSKQTLSYYSKNAPERYNLELYYDSKAYITKMPQKTITIVVDDFGSIGGSLLDGFFDLDKEVCFAIFPDETNSISTMKRATIQGRETIIHVPMEPIGYPSVNPGKNAILVQQNENQINRLLSRFISSLPECIGINNHMGSLATTDPDVMQAVMNTLKKHDKIFLDSRTTNVSVAYQIAQKSHLKAFKNDIFLDSPNISQSNMDDKLSQILQMSLSKNNIIAITHCHNKEKLDYLRSFIQKLKKAGYKLIPLSEVGEYKVPEIL